MLNELVKNYWFGLGIVLSESTFKVFYKRKMQNGLVLCQEVTKLFNRIARFTSIPFICLRTPKIGHLHFIAKF